MNNTYPSVAQWEPYRMNPALFDHFFGEKNDSKEENDKDINKITKSEKFNDSDDSAATRKNRKNTDLCILYNISAERCKEILQREHCATPAQENLQNFNIPYYDWVSSREERMSKKNQQEVLNNKPVEHTSMSRQRAHCIFKSKNKDIENQIIEKSHTNHFNATTEKNKPRVWYTKLFDVFEYLDLNSFFVMLFFLFIILLKMFNM